MKTAQRTLVAATLLLIPVILFAADPPPKTTPAPVAASPVQLEMVALTDAMQKVLVAIANNNLAAIPPAIHAVHSARDVTADALRKGAITLPKNPGKLDEFAREDDRFHGELVTLVKAARANDLQAATRQMGVVMNGCTACHLKYRF